MKSGKNLRSHKYSNVGRVGDRAGGLVTRRQRSYQQNCANHARPVKLSEINAAKVILCTSISVIDGPIRTWFGVIMLNSYITGNNVSSKPSPYFLIVSKETVLLINETFEMKAFTRKVNIRQSYCLVLECSDKLVRHINFELINVGFVTGITLSNLLLIILEVIIY